MEEETEAYRILLQMFEVIERTTRRDPRACFNQLVRYLADCVRLRPLPESEHHIGGRLWPLTKPFLESFYKDPQDHLAPLFAEKGCGNKSLGQTMTPRWLAQYINQEAVGRVVEEKQAEEGDEWIRVLDPCTGTGRFLVEAAAQYPGHKLAFFGVELDPDLYRAALVNMRLVALFRPYFLLCADALIVDVGLGSPNWRYANRWTPPDWRTTMAMEDGQTWAEWCQERGHEVEDSPAPHRPAADADKPDPLQPRLL